MADHRHTVLQAAQRTAYGASGLATAQLRRIVEQPDRLIRRHLDRPVKIDHGSLMVRAELSLAAGPVDVAYKRYGARNLLKAFCRWFRRSRASRAWQLGHELLERQIPTPRPLAMCEPRRFRSSGPSYLATEWIDSAENLHIAAWRWADDPPQQRLRRAAQCADSLGRMLGRMHAMQISHRDLKGANLLVVEDARHAETYLIDLDGLRIRRRIGPRRRAADLARLAAGIDAHRWIGRTVCCRFLRAYAGQFEPGEIDWKRLWRDIAARSDRIVRRKRRRGQQVL